MRLNGVLVCWGYYKNIPISAVRNTPGWLITTGTYFSQFWRLEVQDQGASVME